LQSKRALEELSAVQPATQHEMAFQQCATVPKNPQHFALGHEAMLSPMSKIRSPKSETSAHLRFRIPISHTRQERGRDGALRCLRRRAQRQATGPIAWPSRFAWPGQAELEIIR